jgi:signal transduction histidine kinase/integral membrane sensor domain MASE1
MDALPLRLSSTPRATTLRVPRAAVGAFVVGAAYYVGCQAGFALRYPSSGIAFLWPPNAILTAALLLTTARTWPASLAGALAAHALAHTQDGVPAPTWLFQYVGNSVQAVLAAHLVRRHATEPWFGTLRSVAVFIVGAAILASAAASLIPAVVYVQMGWAADYWVAWRARALSNVITTLTLVPPIVLALQRAKTLPRDVSARRVAEFVVLLLGLLATDAVVAVQGTDHPGLSLALYAPAPFLLWAAVRFGPGGLSFALLAAVVITITGALRGQSPLSGATGAETVMAVQMFTGITAMPLMLLAASIEQSRNEQEALRESEGRNSAILRAMPDLMFVQTRDGMYLDCYAKNPGDLLLPPERFLGRGMGDVLPPALAEAFRQRFEQAGSEEPALLEYTLPIGGENRWFEARFIGLDRGKILSIVRDITDRRRAEDALRQAQTDLARIGRVTALGEIAASIAHEVNQPLCAIVSNANVCLRWVDDASPRAKDLRDALTDVVQDGLRASAVVKRTQELVANGSVTKVSLALNPAIREVVDLARGRVQRSGVTLHVDLDDTLPRVLADRVQMEQVVLNLVLNAIDAMRDVTHRPRVLRVRSRRGKACASVSVRDSGTGFAPQDAERLFEPFYTTKPAGLGIGLAICREIVKAHGGRLWATPNAEGGATFRFTLPAMDDANV